MTGYELLSIVATVVSGILGCAVMYREFVTRPELNATVTALSNQITKLEQRIDQLNSDLGNIGSDLIEVENNISSVSNRIVNTHQRLNNLLSGMRALIESDNRFRDRQLEDSQSDMS